MKQRNIYKKSALDFLKGALLPILFSGVVILLITIGIQRTETSNNAEGIKILEDSLRRAIVTCYAIEGRYPESISYIEKHYGIYIDRTKYAVHYSIFASNIMPEFIVYEV